MHEFLPYERLAALNYYQHLSSAKKAHVNSSMPPFVGVIKGHYYECYCNGTDLVSLALQNVSLPQDSLIKIVDCINEAQLKTMTKAVSVAL